MIEPVKREKGRKAYIDGLRGVAMLVVVYGHCLLSKGASEYVIFFVFSSPSNVALFFFISGYLFSTKNGDTISFLKYVLLRLVVPWLVLGLYPYYNIVTELPKLISGENLWFMPALIIGEIVWFFINKYSKSFLQIVIFGFIASIIGLILYRCDKLNYAMINRALTIQWLFVVGFIVRKYETAILEFTRKFFLLIVVAFCALGVIFLYLYPNEFYDIHLNRYYCIPLTWGLIILGIIVIYTFFKEFLVVPKSLILIGQNTLPIYIFSDYGRSLFAKILYCFRLSSWMSANIPYPVIAVFETIFACALCLAFGLLANKYIPEVVGRRRLC